MSTRSAAVKYTSTLLQTLRGDAMDHRLTHGHAAQLTDPFVVPEAELVERRRRQAPRLAAVQKHCKHAACVHLALQPFGYERSADEAAAKCSECLEAAKQRDDNEVDERLS
jgi:hypothetical protein